MMEHCNVTEMISSLIDGELSSKDTEIVSQHLKGCAVCREEFDALKSVDNLLCNVKPLEPSTDFAPGFWKKVDAIEANKTRWWIFKDFSWGWKPALGAVGALLVIAAGTGIFYRPVPSEADPTIMMIAENMTLYNDYEIINNLELFENWEAIINSEEVQN